MVKTSTLALFFIVLSLSCKKKDFNSNTWKAKKEEQYYMLGNIVKSQILIGKSKKEIIELLDTTEIKQFNEKENEWMYVVEMPFGTRATEIPIACLDLTFKNEKVIEIKVRK
jgi:hypothetical protein